MSLLGIYQPESKGKDESCQTNNAQQELFMELQFARCALGHDASNAFFEVGASDCRDAGQGRTDAEFADSQDALGVDVAVAAEFKDLFVAGAFALVHQLYS